MSSSTAFCNAEEQGHYCRRGLHHEGPHTDGPFTWHSNPLPPPAPVVPMSLRQRSSLAAAWEEGHQDCVCRLPEDRVRAAGITVVEHTNRYLQGACRSTGPGGRICLKAVAHGDGWHDDGACAWPVDVIEGEQDPELNPAGRPWPNHDYHPSDNPGIGCLLCPEPRAAHRCPDWLGSTDGTGRRCRQYLGHMRGHVFVSREGYEQAEALLPLGEQQRREQVLESMAEHVNPESRR